MKRSPIPIVVGLIALLLIGAGLAHLGLFEDGGHKIIRGTAELVAAVAIILVAYPWPKRQRKSDSASTELVTQSHQPSC